MIPISKLGKNHKSLWKQRHTYFLQPGFKFEVQFTFHEYAHLGCVSDWFAHASQSIDNTDNWNKHLSKVFKKIELGDRKAILKDRLYFIRIPR